MQKYKIRNANGTVIAQYETVHEPQKPDNYDGEWNVDETDTLNDEPVNSWGE